MRYRVQVRQQVKGFLETLAPESRRRLKAALKDLGDERGDRLALRERLSGYHRLRVGGHRVIFRHLPGRVIECVFVEERSLVYQLFEREVLDRLRHKDENARARPGFEAGEDAAKYADGRTRKRYRQKRVVVPTRSPRAVSQPRA